MTQDNKGDYEVSVPEQTIVGYEDRSGMASGAVIAGQETVGPTQQAAPHSQSHSIMTSHIDLTPLSTMWGTQRLLP
jgi:hypothetical protein